MKKRKLLTLIIAALLTIAPISAPFVNSSNNAQAAQVATNHQTFIKHTYNWNIKYVWNSNTNRWDKIRLRSSRAWQKAFKKYESKDDKRTKDADDRAYNFKGRRIVQEIKKFDAEDHSPRFRSNHAAIYVAGKNKIVKTVLAKVVQRAGLMWAPAFHFTMTNNPKKANVTVRLQTRFKQEVYDAAEYDSYYEPAKHKIIILDSLSMLEDGYDLVGMVYLVAHELGHAIGLPHDTDLDSVMSSDESQYDPTNLYDLHHYQAPWVTFYNKRAVERLYHVK